MGEQVYDAEGMQIQFSDMDENWWCLCTSFGWREADEKLCPEEIRSLALLGVAVRLAHDGKLEHGILPEAVPEWIRKEIRRLIPVGGEA
mgnify:CR=1 FL=1